MVIDLEGIRIGFALTGSYCTFEKAILKAQGLVAKGALLTPIMSQNAYTTDTRFGKACDFVKQLEDICGKKVIHTIAAAEPIGPSKMLDIMLVCPCTGNTMAKLAYSITDSPVVMAVKSHIRNNNPVVLCIASNDVLAGSAKNLGILMNLKPYYFVPFEQDDYINKPSSLVSNFDKIEKTLLAALNHEQIQPVIEVIH